MNNNVVAPKILKRGDRKDSETYEMLQNEKILPKQITQKNASEVEEVKVSSNQY